MEEHLTKILAILPSLRRVVGIKVILIVVLLRRLPDVLLVLLALLVRLRECREPVRAARGG